MVENGAKSKDNPFSFKNFLKANQDVDTNPGRTVTLLDPHLYMAKKLSAPLIVLDCW